MLKKTPILILSVLLMGCASSEDEASTVEQIQLAKPSAQADPPTPATVLNVDSSGGKSTVEQVQDATPAAQADLPTPAAVLNVDSRASETINTPVQRPGEKSSTGLGQVRMEFEKLDCAPLTAAEDDDGIRVSGFVGSQEELDQLTAAVNSLEDVGEVTFQVVVTSTSFCDVLEVALPLKESNSIGSAGASIGVESGAVVLQEDDRVVLEADAPNFANYVYIIYMQEDGKLLHLVPNQDQPDNSRGANETFSVGDKADQPSITVSAPYGDDLVMLVASSEPLFEAQRPLIENGSSFAEGLAKSVETILSSGGKVVADLVFLRTLPRSS